MTRSSAQDSAIWRHIAEELRTRIASGQTGIGSRLPTEHEICASYGVSRTSAIKALNTLVAEGLVRRERGRGRGTTVIATTATLQQRKWVPIVLPNTGHFFGPLAQHLTQQLTAINVFPVLFTEDSLTDDAQWQQLISLGGAATILHGSRTLTPSMDRHWRNLPFPVLLGRWPERLYRVAMVLPDRRSGLLEAARMALSRGCASVMMYEHVVSGGMADELAVVNDIRMLVTAHGKAFHHYPIWDQPQGEPLRLAQTEAALTTAGRKTVILCGADFYAREILSAAANLGWKVGVDFGLVGCNNTPWAEAFNIDSVSLQEQHLAHAIVALIQAGAVSETVVPSVLVERGSIPTW